MTPLSQERTRKTNAGQEKSCPVLLVLNRIRVGFCVGFYKNLPFVTITKIQ